MTSTFLTAAGAAIALAMALPAAAHTPLAACYDNGDGTVVCEGGFSDGSSAAGVLFLVRDARGHTVIEGRMDENGEYWFDKPRGGYSVLFDAGPGHRIEIAGDDITE